MDKGLWRITFDTNPDTCNLNCIMCEEHSPFRETVDGRSSVKPHRLMDFSIIEKVINEAVPLGLKEIIPSTMGEPLLYKHFDNIISLCHQYNLKLNLTTNGTFPGKLIDQWAKELVPVCSDIKVSWNGSTKELNESIMGGSNFEGMLHNLKVLIKERDRQLHNGNKATTITLQSTFMESNVEDLPGLVRLCLKLGIDRLKGHHLWTHFPELQKLSMRRNEDSIDRWNKIVDSVLEIKKSSLQLIGKDLKLANIYHLDPDSNESLLENGACPFLSREAWINWEGRFDPCCAPDKLRKSLGSFGNVKETPFTDIWQSLRYEELVKTYNSSPLCQSCNMKVSL